MKVFLAGTNTRETFKECDEIPYVLQSFYELKNGTSFPITRKRIKENVWQDFLLDSGAFTFLNGKKQTNDNLNQYIERYIEFINDYKVKNFFELDIDSVIGYENVLKIRKNIERKTMKQCIPVWHKSRGLKEYINMTEEYEYASIGGIVTKEIKPSEHYIMHKLLEIADKNNCKMHGLGFTKLKELKNYGFYSVDSTSWLSGCRYGTFYHFNGETLITKNFKDKKAKYLEIDRHNLIQWIKYQKMMDKMF